MGGAERARREFEVPSGCSCEGKPMHPNVNVPCLSQQSVDLQTVDGLHLSDDVAGGGDALDVHSKGLDSTVGLSSIGAMPAVVNTAGSIVDQKERQLLQQQQHARYSTAPSSDSRWPNTDQWW